MPRNPRHPRAELEARIDAMLDTLELAIGLLDAMDGDPDLEPEHGACLFADADGLPFAGGVTNISTPILRQAGAR